MSHKIRYRLLSINARLLRNMLAIIGLTGFLSACSGSSKKENEINQDSLNKVKEQQRLDSIAKAKDDSLAKVMVDSLVQARKDSIANAQPKPLPDNIAPKYGVPIDFNAPYQTKYGSPADF